MSINQPKAKPYDLEERTFLFAKDCRNFISKLPKTLSNIEYGKQLIRSSGSQAANYIEANEKLSKKDFTHRTRICRKEAKESHLWLRLVEVNSDPLKQEQTLLMKEVNELRNIFSAILEKTK
jgi:four helix bundle protein